MRIAVVKKGARNGVNAQVFCPWMINVPPEGGK